MASAAAAAAAGSVGAAPPPSRQPRRGPGCVPPPVQPASKATGESVPGGAQPQGEWHGASAAAAAAASTLMLQTNVEQQQAVGGLAPGADADAAVIDGGAAEVRDESGSCPH